MKIICFGVRDYEIASFKEIEKHSLHEFVLCKEYINDNNYQLAYNYEVIMLRANCILSYNALVDLKEHGLKHILSRTIGYNHLDLTSCSKLNITVSIAPGYSPRSIAEMNLTLALTMLRNIVDATTNATSYDFTVNNKMFSTCLNNLTIGIIGCGNIGKLSATLFTQLGCKVIGYDIYPDHSFKNLEYKSFDEVIKTSDLICLHLSYHKDNYHLFNEQTFNKMKKGTYLINTSRGELISNQALIKAINQGIIKGCALDVVEGEQTFFGKKNDNLSDEIKQLISLYPSVIITPHISSSTKEALNESIMISVNNLDDLLNNKVNKNRLV